MSMIRKALIASAVSMALAGTAQAGSVLFDVNGTAGPNVLGVDRINITTFTWHAGNLLLQNITPSGVSGPAVSQSYLSSMTGSGGAFSYNGIAGTLTYQMSLNVIYAAGAGTSTDVKPGAVGGFFDLFFQPTTGLGNDITGCGYGSHQSAACGVFAGTRILSGTTSLVNTANLTDTGADSITGAGLDQFSNPPDVDGGITTNELGLGSLRVDVDVVTYSTNFFLSNITSLPVDIRHTEAGGGAPFDQANPSDEVVGEVPLYGADKRNNTGAGTCSGAGTLCDIHLQSQSTSTVLTASVPEPGSLALLGLGFAALGIRMRRRLARLAS